MKKFKKKRKHKIFLIIFIVIGFMLYGINCLYRINAEYGEEREIIRAEALRLAQEYVDEKYVQKMIYVDYMYNFPYLNYDVRFSPKDNSNLVFSVYIIEIEDENINPEERVHVGKTADDYFDKYYRYKISEIYKSDMEMIWGSGTETGVTIENDIKKEDVVTLGLHELSTIEEAEDLLVDNYTLFIDVPYIYDNKNSNQTAQRIRDTLEVIKSKKMSPPKLHINFAEDKNEINLYCDYSEFEDLGSIKEIENYLKNKISK